MPFCGLSLKQKRRYLSAFFVFLTPLVSGLPLHADCPRAVLEGGFHAEVSQIIDGDTLEISDGRRVRLIGLNAPELDDSDGNSQPFAAEAGSALTRLIKDSQSRIYLIPGRETRDRHGRLLAHALDNDGRNLSQSLIREGLAARATVFPNDRFADCYQDAENQARAERIGLWSAPGFWLIDKKPLSRQDRGFYIISDRVESIGESKKSIWLNLQHGVALRIAREDLKNFPDRDWQALRDRSIEARGWLNYSQGRHRLRIRGPLNLTVF